MEPPKNYKDKAKILAFQLDNANKAWYKMAVDTATAQVFIVSLAAGDGEVEVLLDINEERLIGQAQERILHFRGEGFTRFVTFNGYKFDWPILMTRSVKYQAVELARLAHDAATSRTHVDIFQTFGREGGLDAWGYQMLGATAMAAHDNPITGGEIGPALSAGRHDEILRHARSRITILRDLAKLANGVGIL